jgi:hypothetical protein
MRVKMRQMRDPNTGRVLEGYRSAMSSVLCFRRRSIADCLNTRAPTLTESQSTGAPTHHDLKNVCNCHICVATVAPAGGFKIRKESFLYASCAEATMATQRENRCGPNAPISENLAHDRAVQIAGRCSAAATIRSKNLRARSTGTNHRSRTKTAPCEPAETAGSKRDCGHCNRTTTLILLYFFAVTRRTPGSSPAISLPGPRIWMQIGGHGNNRKSVR